LIRKKGGPRRHVQSFIFARLDRVSGASFLSGEALTNRLTGDKL